MSRLILSIESSCDDSSIALTDVDTLKVVDSAKLSQEMEHKEYGGVVPELASRLHAVALPKLLERFKRYLNETVAVAVTTHPGLSVSLHEGVIMAKAISSFLDIPIIGVNHLKGHIYSTFIEKEEITPMLSLLVSGGHTQLIQVNSFNSMEILATTIDDSVGEAYDKVAKMLNLGYPGGPIIEKLALEGDRDRFNFPIPLRNSQKIAFSLSGLKNAVRLEIERLKPNLTHQDRCDISASFEKSVLLHLIQKSKKIFKNNHIKDFTIVGGVSANNYIREGFLKLCKEFDKELHRVDMRYTSDNAEMVGRWAIEAYKRGLFDRVENIKVKSSKSCSIGELL